MTKGGACPIQMENGPKLQGKYALCMRLHTRMSKFATERVMRQQKSYSVSVYSSNRSDCCKAILVDPNPIMTTPH